MGQNTVLIIEDDELNMKLVREILKVGGYTTLGASDAETGIILARKHSPDLVLMDMNLPGMSGIDATKFFLRDKTLSKIPIAACTALSIYEDEVEAMQAGCISYINKPYRIKELLDRVDEILNQRL